MKNAFNIVGWGSVIVLLFFLSRSCNSNKIDSALSLSIYDSLTIYRNAQGEQVAEISVLQTENKKQFLAIKSKDSSIIALQSLVKKTNNLLSATILKNATSNNVSGITTVYSRDTIRKDSVIYVFPEYTFARKNQWENIQVKANRDSTSLNYKVFNDFEITQSIKKKGLFKDAVTEITILNKNPYTETLALRSYSIKNQSNKKLYLIIGALVGGTIVYFAPH